MSKPADAPGGGDEDREQQPGINLKLVYGLMLLALLAAIAFAVMIVLPFYHRR